MLTGNKISWSYGSKAILNNLSFRLEEGKITAFMGTSGAGKTTLLRCMARLNRDYGGQILYREACIASLSAAERASAIGFVHQQYHLFPHLTVLKNCTYALKENQGHVLEALKSLGMECYAEAYPCQLSGGQQQRVAIARALALKPKVLLLDEPTSALDPESKKGLENLLFDLTAQGITLGLSSHDMPFIRKVADRIYFLENGELIEEWDCKNDPIDIKPKIKQFLC